MANKSGILKKAVIVLIVVAAVSGILETMKSPEEKEAEQLRRDQQASERELAKQKNDPCANIKTMDDWNEASTLWRMANSECNPKKKGGLAK